MNPVLLLMGLLGLAYIGSFVVGGRAIRGWGLPSGSEYLALGFLLGPSLLGVVSRAMLSGFEAVAVVALGWLALVIGVGYGYVGRRRVAPWRLALGTLVALANGALIGGVIAVLLWRFTDLARTERWLVAGGIGLACSETTRHAVRWVVERHKARGPLSDLIGDLADSDDLGPLLGTAALFALAPNAAHLPWHSHAWQWVGITVGLGVGLGAVAAVLLGKEFRLNESWGVLLGVSVLGIGTSARLGLSPLATMFVTGLSLSLFSRHAEEVREMVAATEKPVLLPALLLAGAHVDLRVAPFLPWVVAAALAVRVLGKLGVGLGIIAFVPTARPAGAGLGLALLSSGALAITVGLTFAFRFPGVVGDTVLAAAAVATVFGEFVGPVSLRRALASAGEIDDASRSPHPAAVAPLTATDDEGAAE